MSAQHVTSAKSLEGGSVSESAIFSPLATNIQHFKTEILKCLEDTIEEKLHDLTFGDEFLDTTPKARSVEGRIDKPAPAR